MTENKPAIYRWKVCEDGTLDKNIITEYNSIYQSSTKISYYKYRGDSCWRFIAPEKMDRFVSEQMYSFNNYTNAEVYELIAKELKCKKAKLEKTLNKINTVLERIGGHIEESST